jgi:hypothetical protein
MVKLWNCLLGGGCEIIHQTSFFWVCIMLEVVVICKFAMQFAIYNL